MLMLKFVVSTSGGNTTTNVFTYIIWLWPSSLGCHTHGESGTIRFYLRSQRLFLKSMKIMAASFWYFLRYSMMRIRVRIWEYIDRRGLNPFWFGRKIFSSSGRNYIKQESIVDLCSSLC